MGGYISHCHSYDDENEYCVACDDGYGIGGKCKDFKCKSCFKCGKNCKTCRKCICTDCKRGSINPLDPNNCIIKEDDNDDIPLIELELSQYECSASMIKLNLFFILIILLLLKIKFH
jgi:hypothetical protein